MVGNVIFQSGQKRIRNLRSSMPDTSHSTASGCSSKFLVLDLEEISRRSECTDAVYACGIFGSPEWLSVMQEAFSYTPSYLVKNDSGGKPVFILPFMEVRSMLTGRRGISVPFSDYCSIFNMNEEKICDVIEYLSEYGCKRKWKYFEMRSEMPDEKNSNGLLHNKYYIHSLNLCHNEDELFQSFSENIRRNIRKAWKSGLSVRVGTDWDSVLNFYTLHTLTRRHHGLPPQPINFFKSLHKRVLAKGSGMVVLVYDKGLPVAGNIYLHQGVRAWYKYGAFDRKQGAVGAPFLAMWEAIRMLRVNGVTKLCLGRSDLESKGLVRFKDGWGASRKTIAYIRYNYALKRKYERRYSSSFLAKSLFRSLSPGMLQLAGRLLYRHVA